MQIRHERPQDVTAISDLTSAAFRDMPYSAQTEARIIEALRSAGALSLSLVAVRGDEILGHAAFSPVRINGLTGDWHGLGPVAVRPDQQRKGIGQALIRHGVHQLEAMNAAGCVVFGNPSYYGRFGFESDPELVYAGAPPGYFQRLVLKGEAPKGDVAYHSGFDVG